LDYNYSLPKSLSHMKHLTKLTFNGGLHGELPDLPFEQYTNGCVLNVGNVFDCAAFPTRASQCQPGPPSCSIGGCTDTSLNLSKGDCDAWKKVVQPSVYFAKAPTPICSQTTKKSDPDSRHKYDPCSCNATLGCDNGRIVSVNLFQRGFAFTMDLEDALSHLTGLQTLNANANSLTGPLPKWLKLLAGSLVGLELAGNNFTGTIDVVRTSHSSSYWLCTHPAKCRTLTGPLMQ
jgi:hypothetical protein